MNIVILDDYQDAVRKLQCASKIEAYPTKVFTNTVKGVGQLSVRLRDADILVLIRERTPISRQLVEKLPRLKLIAQTGRVGAHIAIRSNYNGGPSLTCLAAWDTVSISACSPPQGSGVRRNPLQCLRRALG